MPHCIIEHSKGLNSSVLIDAVYQGSLHSNLFAKDGSDINVRALQYQDYRCLKSHFIHVCVKLLSGRTEEHKIQLAELVQKKLQQLQLQDVVITVETLDIDRQSYSKA